MTARSRIGRVARWTAGGVGVAALAYGAYVATAWYQYGRASANDDGEKDELLDRFMPVFEVAERHQVHVAAPAATTLRSAANADLQRSRVVRAIFKARELTLGATPDDGMPSGGVLAQVQALGWRVLAENPGREIVVGAVTQPWLANVVFRGLPPDEFKAFQEPGYVKIVWNLRADPLGPDRSVFRTETRVATTDRESRARFRSYWARFSPGIILIRYFLLRDLKKDAERHRG